LTSQTGWGLKACKANAAFRYEMYIAANAVARMDMARPFRGNIEADLILSGAQARVCT